MNFNSYKAALRSKFAKCTDTELLSLESRLREGGEIDAANTCSEILMDRRNRPTSYDDEYPRRKGIGFTDEDFQNEYWK